MLAKGNIRNKEAKVLSGLPVRDAIADKLCKFISRRKKKGHSIPHLTIIQLGDLAESSAYIRQKKLFGLRIGATVEHIQFDAKTTESKILSTINRLNGDTKVHGIIVQLPLPKHISALNIIEAIDPKKDVDGLTATNVKHLQSGDGKGIVPATARGVLTLSKAYGVEPKGKHVVVVGRSALVGTPIAQMFLMAGATVTVCHKLTKPLYKYTTQADILVVAAGLPKLITARFVKKGQIVIDVGITAIEKKGVRKLIGDVDEEKVKGIVGTYSPVPGGVGPMTVASLFENLCEVVE